ncbi:hypothetical protein [Bradyrhizobium sp. ORS 375]|uniref:hypothetical protein n=1 Tax=Bradyrhizobium sp. (strain ORS 375) TaxID=566679 RepID=UPI0002E95DDC|nr:hypothetical protein [Bradyrhizobium sp. ORS 375]
MAVKDAEQTIGDRAALRHAAGALIVRHREGNRHEPRSDHRAHPQRASIDNAVRYLIQNDSPKGKRVGWPMMASILVEAD